MIWAAAIMGIASAAANGIATYQNNKKLANAYSKAAKTYTDATKKYSGVSEYRRQQNAGDIQGNELSVQDTNYLASQGAGPYEQGRSRYAEGNTLGQQTQSQIDNANFNKETAESQAALKQAGVDFAVNNQTQQAVMNGIGGLADMYKNTQGGTQ